MRSLSRFLLDTIEVLVFAIAIFLFIYLLILQPHKIKGASMEPNFPDGQYLITDKVSYKLGEPERGDVVVFKAPKSNGDEFIKRIIGLPGERVGLKDNAIFINNKPLAESYIGSSVVTSSGAFFNEREIVTVPAGEFFVLGDNRPHSSDSRSWGFVPKSEITGKAWFIYWPTADIGGVEQVTYAF